MRAYEILNENKATHLTKLGKFHKGDDPLAQYVPQRKTHKFALHPDAWEDTFYSLTLKDPRKIRYYGPKSVEIVPGTLIADMAIANKFYRAKSEEEKEAFAQAYIDSVKQWPQDLSDYKLPELLIPQTEELTEKASRGRPIVAVDIQPAYSGMMDGAEDETFEAAIRFVNDSRAPCLMFVNAEEEGLTSDTVADVQMYWEDSGFDPSNWGRVEIYDKGYGYLRSWMDIGIENKYIIRTIREMYSQKVYDSRMLFDEDEEKQLEWLRPIAESINTQPEYLIDDGIRVGWAALDQLKRYNNCYLIGGGREECLAEVAILMSAFNIKYTLIDSLIYG